MQIQFWMKNMKGNDHLGSIGLDERTLSKWNLLKERGRLCIAFNCLRLGSSGQSFSLLLC
jgi:hypothetical protein